MDLTNSINGKKWLGSIFLFARSHAASQVKSHSKQKANPAVNIKRANLHKIHKQDAVLYSRQYSGVEFFDCSDNTDVL